MQSTTGFQVQECKVGVVVQHFFKMGYLPAGVDHVSEKPAAKVVTYATICHRIQRQHQEIDHIGIPALFKAVEQEAQLRDRRKFVDLSEAALNIVATCNKAADGEGTEFPGPARFKRRFGIRVFHGLPLIQRQCANATALLLPYRGNPGQ